MSAPVPPMSEVPLACPTCGNALDMLAVNPAGELIGCEECAEERGLAYGMMTPEEWNAADAVSEVLAHYGLDTWHVDKPAMTATRRPRAHYWEVTSGKHQYYLKRFHDWFPSESVRYTHSFLDHLREQQQPVPTWVPAEDGSSFVEIGESRWALYRALPGQHASDRDWMWGRPKAAEMLAALHEASAGFEPEGQSFEPWNAWTLDTVDRVLESWPEHPDLSPDLLEFVRERLATRYYGELYPELPKLVVHGDYVTSNVLWRGEAANATITGVLDFERAHHDTALFDFAWGLGDRRPPLLRATVATYSRVRPLSPVEREALPESLLLGAVMGIDIEMSYYQNMERVHQLAVDLNLLVRDLEPLRKAVALKSAVVR